ncbi:MAG: MarR family transcriptional regulator [Ideonella sp.]|jgi:MarR family transcriptional regulator, lower aerobic nicotinate degradation pathway regulator|nr:MarR family transcriptional regulator [Ideonella sp.]MBL0148598.1 MarR family transcriptional regulator [Ideonella sp.]
MRRTKAKAAALEEQPGYYIRRLQQIAVAIFLEETEAHGITPVQYAALFAARRDPGLDQRTLAATIGFDTSTIGGVIDRLERRGFIERHASPTDRRVRLLHVTPAGSALLDTVVPAMLQAQKRILAPLAPAQRPLFLAMLKQVVDANNGLSRAPSDG